MTCAVVVALVLLNLASLAVLVALVVLAALRLRARLASAFKPYRIEWENFEV